jgi:uncharacterized membrane protein YhhN
MWIAICAVGVIIALAGERYSKRIAGATGKLTAASAYIAAAWSSGAANTQYGQILLFGMAFCWAGDLLLVANNNQRLFLLGLASFLLGHLAYIGAFTVQGVSYPASLAAGLIMAAFAWRVLKWLRPHLEQAMRLPVRLYVIAISLMMTMAVGAYAAGGNQLIPLGALLFLLSDLAVARDRFIAPGFVNRAWGLPVYFCGQMALAFSAGFL